jgi:large subunit ribosomal protein L25
VPASLEVDVSDLDVGDSIHVQEISLPAGVNLPPGVNYTVVTVVSPTSAAKEEAAEEAVEEGAEVEEGKEEEGSSDAD